MCDLFSSNPVLPIQITASRYTTYYVRDIFHVKNVSMLNVDSANVWSLLFTGMAT